MRLLMMLQDRKIPTCAVPGIGRSFAIAGESLGGDTRVVDDFHTRVDADTGRILNARCIDVAIRVSKYGLKGGLGQLNP